MHVYMLRQNDGLYCTQSSLGGKQETAAIWVHVSGAQDARKRANFPCEVVKFSLEPVAARCPICGAEASFVPQS